MSEEKSSCPEGKLVADDLSEYLRAKDPGKAELAGLWRTALGLQKVDGLTPSAYLVETACRNIEGEITVAEAGNLIGEYYKSKKIREEAAKTRTDEADIVSQRIAAILAEPTFSFSPASYAATPTSKQRTPTSNGATPTSTPVSANGSELRLSRAVRMLLDVLEGERSRAQLMKAIGIKDRVTFTDYYLSPAVRLGLVEMTQPDSPRSPTQKYRLTAKGTVAVAKLDSAEIVGMKKRV